MKKIKIFDKIKQREQNPGINVYDIAEM